MAIALPTPKILEKEYTQLIEVTVKRARTDFVAWLNFLWPQVRGQEYVLSAVHIYVANLLADILTGNAPPKWAVSLPRQHGKQLRKRSLVPTPSGFRKIESIKVGDFVFAVDGSPIRVLARKEWANQEMYRVHTDDKYSVDVGGPHEWTVKLPGGWRTQETKWLFYNQSKARPKLPEGQALNLPEADLPIHPYVLGYWLGNGGVGDGSVCVNLLDVDFLQEKFSSLGYDVSVWPSSRKKPGARMLGFLRLKEKLNQLGVLNDKHIPEAYLWASVEQRLHLLQGLMDSDGHIAKQAAPYATDYIRNGKVIIRKGSRRNSGQCEFCSTNRRLGEQFRQLVVSLGTKATWCEGRATLNGKDCGPKYRVLFYRKNACSSPRKGLASRDPARKSRYIRIERLGIRDTGICIQVDHPSGLFLAGEGMVPTHNSRLIAVRGVAWALGAFPKIQIAMTNFSHSRLTEFIHEIQRIIDSDRYRLVFPEMNTVYGRNRADYKTFSNGSSVEARSVGSKWAGKRIDLLIIDDPHAGREEAENPRARAKTVTWYFGDCVPPLAPNAKQFLIQSRWHREDLVGALTDPEYTKRLEEEGYHKQAFSVINFPAIALEDDVLGRKRGDALFPEVRDIEFLKGIRSSLPIYEWESQYQENPQTAKSGQVNTDNLKRISLNEVPKGIEWVRGWDLALTEKTSSDFTAGPLCAYDRGNDHFYIIDLFHDKLAWAKMKPKLVEISLRDKREHGVNRIGMEAVAGFLIGLEEIRSALMGEVKVELRNNPTKRDKLMRAQPWLNKVEAGKVFMVKGEWNRVLLAELSLFPSGKNDDIIDGLSICWESFSSRKLLYA